MAHKKPTDLIELAHDWERKLTESEQVNADLLAALKAFMERYDVPKKLRETHFLTDSDVALLDQARAAIAKAE